MSMEFLNAAVFVGRAFCVLQNQDASELATAPDLFIWGAVGVLVFLLVAGVVIWRMIFSAGKTDFSREFQEGAAEAKATTQSPRQNELDPKAVSKSAETVSNKEDVAVVDELRSRFSSQQTVDAMGDQSVSAEDGDEEE